LVLPTCLGNGSLSIGFPVERQKRQLDIDLLYGSRRKIKLQGDIDRVGLIEVAKSVDKTFQVATEGGYRAINDWG
jgi:hypothetical protein